MSKEISCSVNGVGHGYGCRIAHLSSYRRWLLPLSSESSTRGTEVSMSAPQCFRHELKYGIDALQYATLRAKLSSTLKRDAHVDSDGRYHVRSLYFDDFKNTALFEKLAGVRHRKKYRIRVYNFDASYVKLERKTKLGQYINKECTTLSRDDIERIMAGSISFLAGSKNPFLRQFYTDCRCELPRPVVIVDYYREAYTHPISNVRITFDTDLRTSIGTGSFFHRTPCPIRVIDAPSTILEVKFNSVFPQCLCGLFPDTITPRSAIGKFVLCRIQQMQHIGKLNN